MSYKVVINHDKDIVCDNYYVAEDLSSAYFIFTNYESNFVKSIFMNVVITHISIIQGLNETTYDCKLKATNISHEEILDNAENGDDNSNVITHTIKIVLKRINIEDEIDELKDFVGIVDTSKLSLEEYQLYIQDKNKKAMAKYISENPLLWTDEKYYGITQEDQSEMMADLMVYDFETQLGNSWTLEWHNIHSACRTFSYEEFCQLLHSIINIVYPIRRLQETYKEQIFECNSKDELEQIVFDYSSVDPRKQS